MASFKLNKGDYEERIQAAAVSGVRSEYWVEAMLLDILKIDPNLDKYCSAVSAERLRIYRI